MTVRPSLMPFYAGRPYGVQAMPFDPRDGASLDVLLQDRGYDLALVPGDNRYSWLAAALDAAWVIAFAGDRPAHKSWMVDELVPYSATPMAWADMNTLLVEGPAPKKYAPSDWPAPPCAPFERPSGRYAVLHVEASTPLRHWENEKWLALAARLLDRGILPVWSAGPGGLSIIEGIDKEKKFKALGHRLDLAQLWHLVAGAALLVCPDTGVAHIGKLTFTPTVTLYGPSSALLFGKGEFWSQAPFREVTVADFPCRDQHTLFKRRLEWVRRCQRTPAECAEPRCMQAIGVEQVLAAVSSLGL
jgi:ADP-heptose:LPS heptosyltransferase